MRRVVWLLCACSAFVVLAGCAYPRRRTSLAPVGATATEAGSATAPPEVYEFTVVSAQPNPRNRGDTEWDDRGGLPDCFVRLLRDGVVVWESPTIEDSLTPTWNATAPRNVRIDSSASFQIEVWDRDTIGSDPVGIWRGRGLPPGARAGLEARVLLEGGSWLTIRVNRPNAHHGTGVNLYEVRGESFLILEVEPYSPAGRGGLVAGDSVIGVGANPIGRIGVDRAIGALSMAADRGETLQVLGTNGQVRTVTLDRGYVWLVM